VGYIFPFSKNDKTSPPSTIGAAGLVTNNGSSGFGVGAQLFFKENRYEVTSLYGHGNINYNFYGGGIPAGNVGFKLPLEQAGQLFFAEALRRIKWQFFLGPRFWNGDSIITVRPSSGQTPVPPLDLGLHTTLRALGLRLARDTRPDHFYPTKGMFTQFTSDFFAKSLGSKYTFQSYRFTFNKYGSLKKNQVLAYNLFVCGTGGDPPFYGKCIYGTNNELRGYEAGRYFDRYMVATQAEYRLSLPKGFGLAAFGGIGEVVPGGQDIFRINNFLPSIGGGPRFELSKKYHLNLRADFARGKNSWTWSMGVGEAF
jgi:outer membrane protein assembly factor BamA